MDGYLSHIAKMQRQTEGKLLLHRNPVIKHSTSLEHNQTQIQFTQVLTLGTSWPTCLTQTNSSKWVGLSQTIQTHPFSSPWLGFLGLCSSQLSGPLVSPAQTYGCSSSCLPELMRACRIQSLSVQEN